MILKLVSFSANSLIIHEEKTKEVWKCDLNSYYNIWQTFALNLSKNHQLFQNL